MDQGYDRLDENEYQKLIDGIVNNAADAVPYRDPSRGPGTYTRFIATDTEDRTVSIHEVAKDHIPDR